MEQIARKSVHAAMERRVIKHLECVIVLRDGLELIAQKDNVLKICMVKTAMKLVNANPKILNHVIHTMEVANVKPAGVVQLVIDHVRFSNSVNRADINAIAKIMLNVCHKTEHAFVHQVLLGKSANKIVPTELTAKIARKDVNAKTAHNAVQKLDR